MKVNVSIDDISRHPKSRANPIVDRCESLLNWFPDMKFTFFVPIAYWRRHGETATALPLWIEKDPELVLLLQNLPRESYEIGIHGIFHSTAYSNNNEMLFLNESSATAYIKDICETFNELHIAFSNVIRPCGWAISPEAAKAFNDFFDGDMTLSLHRDYCPDILKETIQKNSIKTVWCDCCPPFLPLIRKPEIEIVYHACEWDKNYLSRDRVFELRDFLLKMGDLEFKFIRELKDGKI